ncbi:MAG: methyltransferase domain-containing protein [Gammaproteobacteria bacterium]|nr:methyltransferase domain-containing protein [Gammaproteobacteria bacterium]
MTGQTGRGAAEETPEEIADYFRRCFVEYFEVLGVKADAVPDYLSGKTLLEYGPGDVQGVALLMLAHGASRVYCVDRFPMVALHEKNVAVLQSLLDGLEGQARQRAEAVFVAPGNPASGFAPERVTYVLQASGLLQQQDAVDLIYSRAVLEHVNDLEATFLDMARALRPGGVMIHQVDLKSHGLHRRNPLDFLTWPPFLWNAMYSHKGAPNRWRVDAYRNAAEAAGLALTTLSPTQLASQEDVAEVRPHLADILKGVSDEDLSWLGFWIVGRHR